MVTGIIDHDCTERISNSPSVERKRIGMVDPIFAPLGAAAAVETTKVATHVFSRLLGPSADLVGAHWAESLSNRLSNVHRVSALADRRTLMDAPGAVPPRVAAGIFDAASYSDDEFVVEYLSGVLASSRSPSGKDDSGISWTALVARLPSEQLRLHYIIYTVIRRLLLGRGYGPMQICNTRIYIPFGELFETMSWAHEDLNFWEAFYGLHREGLVGDNDFAIGPPDALVSMSNRRVQLPDHGFFCKASRAGLGLYLWGLGHGGLSIDAVIDSDLDLDVAEASNLAEIITQAGVLEEFPPLPEVQTETWNPT